MRSPIDVVVLVNKQENKINNRNADPSPLILCEKLEILARISLSPNRTVLPFLCCYETDVSPSLHNWQPASTSLLAPILDV